MKNWNDVIETTKKEVSAWFNKQCQNQYAHYYWFYTESKPYAPGRVWIGDENEENNGYCLHRLSIGDTKETAIRKFLNIAGKLPILEYQD